MNIAIAQARLPLGDFSANSLKVLDVLKKAGDQADLIVFPEGGIWGYPPKDFLWHDHFFALQEEKFKLIQKRLKAHLLLPSFAKIKGRLQNGAFLFEKGGPKRFFAKEFLPDQGVFFESRYFAKGRVRDNFFIHKGKKIQILICEDMWQTHTAFKADLLIVANASPYTEAKPKARLESLRKLAQKSSCPALYVNRIGAQDGLIFDGGSFALDQKGRPIWQGAFFEPDFKIVNFFEAKKTAKASAGPSQTQKTSFLRHEAQIEKALVLGIREFFLQAGFSKAVLGLSGGIDSALTAYLAVRALGNQKVSAWFLPGPYTRPLSQDLARQTALNLKIPLREKSISPFFESSSQSLAPKGKWRNPLSLQNLQSRIRALILLAQADESGALLLSTANKSELAVGYSTLYGDLAGALGPIGDVFKTDVYALSRFINKRDGVFPKALFSREPTAELCPGQKDKDDLPPYSRLDPILKRLLRGKKPLSTEERRLSLRIKTREFKRAQAPPILKVSDFDLGESWRRPIVGKFPP